MNIKAPHIEITSAVFDQIVRYNMVLHVKILNRKQRHPSFFVAKIDYEKTDVCFPRRYTGIQSIGENRLII